MTSCGGRFWRLIIAAEEVGFELVEFIVEQGMANFLGEADDEAEIVGGGEAVILGFFGGVAGAPESAEAAEGPASAASGAVATGVEGGAGVAELAEIEIAILSVNFAMASFAHGGDAVKGIGAHFGADENVVGVGKAEEMTRFIGGEFFVAPPEDFAEIFFEKSATEAETIEANAVNLELSEVSGGAAP